MKNKKTKGFTLVELLVVIAIIAILATVSIVGYLSFSKKARVSNDIGLVTQLNRILVANEAIDGKNKTMHDAVLDVREHGFEVANMSPTTDGYDVVWSQVDDRFVLMNGNETVFSYEDKQYTVDYRLWKAYDEFPEEALSTNLTYSIYLRNTYVSSSYNIPTSSSCKVGIDQGEFLYEKNGEFVPIKMTVGTLQNIDGVKPIVRGYKNDELYIKGSGYSDLNVYGEFDKLNVDKSAMDSVHFYGNASIVQTSGLNTHIVFEEGSKALAVKAEKGKFTIKDNSKITNLYVIGKSAVINLSSAKAEPENITLKFDPSYDYGITESQITIGDKPVSAENKLSKEVKKQTFTEIDNALTFAGGSGTVEDPYLISTQTHLSKLNGKKGYFKLANDISFFHGCLVVTNDPNVLTPLYYIGGTAEGALNLDLNGYTIKADERTKEKANTKQGQIAFFSVVGDLVITGEGKIDSDLGKKTCYAFDVNNEAVTLTIAGGTYTGSPSVVQVTLGKLLVTGGTFMVNGENDINLGKEKYIINAIDENFAAKTAKIEISGGTFGFNPDAEPEGAGSTYVAAAHHVVDHKNGTYSVVSD